jgi:hypothetical protein
MPRPGGRDDLIARSDSKTGVGFVYPYPIPRPHCMIKPAHKHVSMLNHSRRCSMFRSVALVLAAILTGVGGVIAIGVEVSVMTYVHVPLVVSGGLAGLAVRAVAQYR